MPDIPVVSGAKNQNMTDMYIFPFENYFSFSLLFVSSSIIYVFILLSFFKSRSLSFSLTKCNRYRYH